MSALDDVASQLRDTSKGIQELRSGADQAIASSVEDVNEQLKTIASLNSQIKQAAAVGQPTGDLEDQRNTALQEVASRMDVSYFLSSTGDMQVYTTSGQALVDGSVHLLSHTASASVTASTTYDPASTGGLGGIMLNGVDVTSQIKSGDIGALIEPARQRAAGGASPARSTGHRARRRLECGPATRGRRCRRRRR